MTSITLRGRVASATTAFALIGAALVGCSGPGGQLGDGLTALKSCPATGFNTQVGVDASDSARSEAAKVKNLKEIAKVVHLTALCGGTIRVFTFVSSSGQTTTIYQGELEVDASTDNAKVRKAEKLTEAVMAEIEANYNDALSSQTASGTDVIGMLDLLRDARAQAPDEQLNALLLTDGLTNLGGIDPTTVTSTDAAEALADQVPVPDLSGAQIDMVGIGHQASGELPSSVIENVKAFWKRLLSRTGATTVLVVTEGR